MEMCIVADSVTELPPGTVTPNHCVRATPPTVVTATDAGSVAPEDSELPVAAMSTVPLSRMVSRVAAPAAALVMTRLITTVVLADSVAAGALAEMVRAFVGAASVVTVLGREPENFTCVPEEM